MHNCNIKIKVFHFEDNYGNVFPCPIIFHLLSYYRDILFSYFNNLPVLRDIMDKFYIATVYMAMYKDKEYKIR